MKRALVLAVIGLVVGCGDDDRPGLMDAGGDGGSVGPDAGGDAGSTFQTFTWQIRYLSSLDDAPVEGVKVAVDTDRGRFEGVSDASGEVAFEVEYVEDRHSSISAREGYVIVGRADATFAGIADLDLEMDGDFTLARLVPLDTTTGDIIRMSVSATGVPVDGRYCAGLGAWINICFPAGDEGLSQSYDTSIIDERFGDDATCFAFDADSNLVDFEEATWIISSDGSRALSCDFDGTLDTPPVTRDVTLMLPSDPASPFNTEELDTEWASWFWGASAGDHLPRTALTNVAVGVDSITMTISAFPIVGEELVWAISAFADFADPVRTLRWYSAEPAGTLEIMDVPRVMLADSFDREVRWTEPSPDVDYYLMQFVNNADRTVISISTGGTSATMPPLPSAYDREISFPFAGASGGVRIVSGAGTIPPDDMAAGDPYAVDGQSSIGPRFPITF